MNVKNTTRILKLLKRQGNLCGLCRKYLALEDANFDHIIPKSNGGGSSLRNLQATHEWCNNYKGNTRMTFL